MPGPQEAEVNDFCAVQAQLWKSLLQMMIADGVHGLRKDLYEFIK